MRTRTNHVIIHAYKY